MSLIPLMITPYEAEVVQRMLDLVKEKVIVTIAERRAINSVTNNIGSMIKAKDLWIKT